MQLRQHLPESYRFLELPAILSAQLAKGEGRPCHVAGSVSVSVHRRRLERVPGSFSLSGSGAESPRICEYAVVSQCDRHRTNTAVEAASHSHRYEPSPSQSAWRLQWLVASTERWLLPVTRLGHMRTHCCGKPPTSITTMRLWLEPNIGILMRLKTRPSSLTVEHFTAAWRCHGSKRLAWVSVLPSLQANAD